MADLKQLYQELILDHAKNPRNRGRLSAPTHQASGDNPVCGDSLRLDLKIDSAGRIQQIKFESQGCAIATAAASIMSGALSGKSVAQARQLIKDVYLLLNRGQLAASLAPYTKIQVFKTISDFPGRVKCASLPWHTLEQALTEQALVGQAALRPQAPATQALPEKDLPERGSSKEAPKK